MKSGFISDVTVKLMKLIDQGNIQVSETYIDLVLKIHIFFQELIKFAKNIGIVFYF